MSATSTLFDLAVPWWELVLRSAVVYVALLLLLRLTGKRQVGQLAPNDLVLLLILSNAVQNSMNAGDVSLIGGLVSAITLVGLNYLVNALAVRSKRIEKFVDGQPQILARDGHIFARMLADCGITETELMGALHQNGCASVQEAHLVILETNGSISVLKRDTRTPPSGPGRR